MESSGLSSRIISQNLGVADSHIALLDISFLKRVLVNLVLVSFSRNTATVAAGAVKEKKKGRRKRKEKERRKKEGRERGRMGNRKG